MSDDGLVEITLGRDYADNKAGDTIRRSSGRVAWLREHGFEATPPPAEEEPEPEATEKPKRSKGKAKAEPEPEAPPETPAPAEEETHG